MIAPFELDWLGGWSERRVRRRRPGLDDLPWGTLDVTAWAADDLVEARRVWTDGCFTEYASAAAFGNLATALLECGAPVDLSAVAADLMVDELDHVELVARLLGELGGAVPYQADLARVSQAPDPDATPLMRALELAVTVSCVGENLSVPALAASRAGATAPLVAAALDRLIADEGVHAEVGWRILAWAEPRLSPGDRVRLGELAVGAIAAFAPLWQAPACTGCEAPGLGVTPRAAHGALLRRAVRERVLARLARAGIPVDAEAVAPLLA